MIYIVSIIVALILMVIIRAIMGFNPNKNKQSKEKMDNQIRDYLEMLKKYQDKNKS